MWISKSFSVEENSIYDDDMAAKIELLQLHEDACPKTDLISSITDKGKFWADTSI